ncbi:hypothetical protein [Cognatilysobacter terrigena]|uniref:hypothetical protein n=1 Tax=Cognatilysobacter terrigena TaxID=2488749 RepID=UPI00105C9A7B|nr:hypothetical protein [Lysobacter terrigena]
MATNNNGSSGGVATTGTFRSNIGEAGSSLKQAAVDTGDALKNAAVAAGEELRVGKANLKADLADSALASIAAAELAGGAAREQMDQLMDKGRDLLDSAAELVRERPLVSFGVAFAAGWMIAKMARSGGNR